LLASNYKRVKRRQNVNAKVKIFQKAKKIVEKLFRFGHSRPSIVMKEKLLLFCNRFLEKYGL